MDDVERTNRRVMRGSPRPLPQRPKGDGDSPEVKRYVRRVADLENPEDVLTTIMARARAAADFRSLWEEEWREAVRAWFQRTSSDREDSWEHDHYLPIIFKHVETAIPSLVSATMDGNRVWRLVGMTRQGKNAAQAQEALLNWQAYTVSRYEEAVEDLYWWSALIGTAYIDHYWDYRQETRPWPVVRDRLGRDERPTGEKIKEITEQEVTTADHPRVVCLNPLDVFPDPGAEMGDDAEWFIERVRTTIGALRDAAGQGHIDGEALEKWIAEWKPADLGSSTDTTGWFDLTGDTYDEWLRDIGYSGRDDQGERQADYLTNDKPVTVLRYRSKSEIVTLGSPQHVIGYSLNPYIHGKTGIVIHHFFKVPNCPFGRGVGTILLDHQQIANENINRWLDTAAVEAMAPVIVDRAAVSILDDEWVLEPNKIIRARHTEAVKRMDVPAPTALAMQLDAHLQRDADDVTGFSEQARGAPPPASQTATAFSGLQNNLRTRLVLHVRRAARTIRQSGELLLALNLQFLTEPQVCGLVGEDALDYISVTPEEIVGRSVVRATLSAARANPELRAQRLMQFLQVSVPLFQAGMHKDPVVGRLLRMILDENEVENADLLIPKEQGRGRDPILENEALKRGITLQPHPLEEHMEHLQVHGALFEELTAAGLTGAASIVQQHVMAHMQAAQQAAALMAGPGGGGAPAGAGVAPPGGDEGQQAGGATEGALARNGVPGASAPGPGAPPGRPL